MMPVAVLDTVSAMLSSGLLLWYFVLEPATVSAGLRDWEAFTALLQPACDLGLFLLALGVLLTVRSSFAAFLACGLLLLLVTDGTYLALRTGGTYPLADWPVLFWAGGVALLGIAALHRGSAESLAPEEELCSGGNLQTFSFWLGPLSPPLQYGVLLVWGTFHPSLPDYVLLCGSALLGIFAVRTYAVSRVEGVLADKREASARQLEQCRILGELHDTAKQSVRGTSMMIEACLEAHEKKGDTDNLRDLLGRTLDVSREAGHQLSADSVEEVGTEEVQGSQATHYRAIVDLEKAAQQQGADQNAQLRQVYDRIEQQLGSNTLPMDVWLDEQGRVVRLEMNMPMPVPGGASSQEANGQGQIGITEEFYDFGTPVSVEAPPEDQTADINDLISAQQAPNPR